MQNGLIACRVRIGIVDDKGDEGLPRRRFTLRERRLFADEIGFVESDEAIEPGSAGGLVPGKFTAPDTKALLQPHRAVSMDAEIDEAKVRASAFDLFIDGDQPIPRHIKLEGQFP